MPQLPEKLAVVPRGPLDARVRVPGSKSITNRALPIAALASGDSELLLFGAPLEWSALALGIASASAATWLTFSVGRACRIPDALAAAAGLAVAATGRFTWSSLSGMETCLAAALALAVVRVHLLPGSSLKRSAVLGALIGLAAQARPELLLLFPLVAFLEWRRRGGAEEPRANDRTQRFKGLAVLAAAFAVVALPYVVFCLATTGRPLPNTFYAKSLLPLQTSAAAFSQLRITYLPKLLRWAWLDNALIGLLLIPGLVFWIRRRSDSALVYLWPLAFCLYALVLYPRHFSLSRYTIPLIPFFALLAMAAVAAALERLRRSSIQTIAVGAVFLLIVGGAAWRQNDFRQIYRANVGNLLNMHVAMADWIDTQLPKDARVAANDIGAITYYGGRYCIDTMGLVSSDLITRQLRAREANRSIDPEGMVASYLADTRPHYAVLFPSWYPRLTRQPWLEARHPIRYTNTTGGGDLMIAYEVIGTPTLAAPRPADPPTP